MMSVLLLGSFPETAFAKNASGAAAFDNLTWDKILEESVTTKKGVVQSICATDDYIICLENSGDTSKENDIAYAYYRNPWDENGNPVEQYSLAFKNDKWDWEHCNGMCFNQDQDEIYVALYTSNNPEARGCIYVMDPHTLDFKRSIKIADNYNILGIGYYPKKGTYMIQANAEGDYGIKILDGNFNKIADFGAGDLGLGSNSQDMCVCGDYIMNFPLTFDKEGQGSYMNVYEIDQGRPDDPDDYAVQSKLLKEVEMDLGNIGNKKVEPESICEVDDGEFIVTVNIMNEKGKRKFAWYKTELGGYSYDIETECSNGTITDSANNILKGDNYTVSYKPNPGYKLASITIDGEAVDPAAYPGSFEFTDLQSDHRIVVTYVEKDAAIDPTSDQSDKDPFVFEKAEKKQSKWKWILLGLLIIALVVYSIYRYRKYLRIERRKKYLRRKIRREKERVAMQKAMEEIENLPIEESSIEDLLHEIEDMETAPAVKKKSASRKEK